MIKKINFTFFSNSRSEFGLIKQIINEIKKYKRFKYNVLISGTHFVKEYGKSVDEIKKSKIDFQKIYSYDTKRINEKNIIKNLSRHTLKLTHIFKNIDYVVLFGDRIDLLPIIINCLIFNKKIIHFGGGEETKGSIDNKVRKLVSSIAEWHFVASERYKLNLIKMGVSKNKIFNVGTLSVNKEMILDRKVDKDLKLKNRKLVSLTYHPISINTDITAIDQVRIILESLSNFKKQIFTIINAPGFEKSSDDVIKYIKKWIQKRNDFKFCRSLGISKYSRLIKNSELVIGNSSSGVIMAPFFSTPSINIGNRQDGRIKHSSVINCKLNKKEIIFSINNILKKKKKRKIKYLLGRGDAAKKTIKILKKIIK